LWWVANERIAAGRARCARRPAARRTGSGTPRRGRRARAHRVGEPADPRFDAGWAGDLDLALAVLLVERREQEQRDAAEVIGVEMGDQDHVDLVDRDAELVQAAARGGAAVDQRAARRAAQQDADWRRPPAPNASLVPTKVISVTTTSRADRSGSPLVSASRALPSELGSRE
jgi:hypothetical protein